VKNFIAGKWVDKSAKIEIRNPFDNSVIDTVPKASFSDLQRALLFAEKGARVMARLSSYERWRILRHAADLIAERNEELGRLISREEGKIIGEGRAEASRAVETMTGSAEEAKRIHGETVPLDADPSGNRRLGFTLRVPCGVVAAITPFNYPLNLVCHKVGPALASGNSIIVKPASNTPLSALRLTEILLEANLPAEGIQCITGSGSEIGDSLVSDHRVRKVTFTGSREIGERICRNAGIKKVTMELGSNSPVIIMADADLNKVASILTLTAYGNAGQSCISTQRVFVAREIYGDFLNSIQPKVASLTTGNQLDERQNVGPMIDESEAVRVDNWVNEAVDAGARVIAGGERRGAIYVPTVIADVRPDMRVCCEEVFGPAMAVAPFDDIEEAIALANRSVYGLAAGIFTNNIEWGMKFAREVEAGNVQINWGSQWRVDLMPYGGLKNSGFGKEGPKYAVEEMTELKMVTFHLNS
jgi:acyl-CoA reductase-like NAD-dependent aldehyde dehydrogenase